MNGKASEPISDWLAEVEKLLLHEERGSFHEWILGVAVRRVGASGGAAWRAGADGRWEVASQIGVGGERIDQVDQRWVGHRELLSQVWQTRRAQIVAARLDRPLTENKREDGTSIPLVLLVAPVYSPDSSRGCLLELFLAGRVEDSSTRESLQALEDYCRGVGRIGSAIVGASQPLSPETLEFAKLCANIHGSLEIHVAAAAVANEVRAWMGCSRVSILCKRGRRCRLVAVSDLDEFDRRAESVKSLERLATHVTQGGQPICKDGIASTRGAGMDAPRDTEESDGYPWLMGAVPLPPPGQAGGPIIGVLVVEDFDEAAMWTVERRARFELAAVQATIAIGNVVRHQNLPLHRLGRFLQRLGWGSVASRIVKWGIAALVLGSIVALLTLVQRDFDITGRGILSPAIQRDVFAGVDGIVDELRVAHGNTVESDTVLLRMRSPQLEQQRAQLEGQLRTTEQQIADLAVLRGGRNRDVERDSLSHMELAARQEELNSVIENLKGQIAALEGHERELTLRSPIAGRVLTWEVEQLLEGRPVQAGQRLLSVADVDGRWVVEIRVPDRDISHVLAARRAADPLRVTFMAATDLETHHTGIVVDIAQVVEYDSLDGPVVVVTVDVDQQQNIERRPGASVYPRIHCGRRALGYIWFRRLYETLASWMAL